MFIKLTAVTAHEQHARLANAGALPSFKRVNVHRFDLRRAEQGAQCVLIGDGEKGAGEFAAVGVALNRTEVDAENQIQGEFGRAGG